MRLSSSCCPHSTPPPPLRTSPSIHSRTTHHFRRPPAAVTRSPDSPPPPARLGDRAAGFARRGQRKRDAGAESFSAGLTLRIDDSWLARSLALHQHRRFPLGVPTSTSCRRLCQPPALITAARAPLQGLPLSYAAQRSKRLASSILCAADLACST